MGSNTYSTISLGLILCRLVMMDVITVALVHINFGDDALPVGCSEIKIGTGPVHSHDHDSYFPLRRLLQGKQ